MRIVGKVSARALPEVIRRAHAFSEELELDAMLGVRGQPVAADPIADGGGLHPPLSRSLTLLAVDGLHDGPRIGEEIAHER